jgi:hypothetical protein
MTVLEFKKRRRAPSYAEIAAWTIETLERPISDDDAIALLDIMERLKLAEHVVRKPFVMPPHDLAPYLAEASRRLINVMCHVNALHRRVWKARSRTRDYRRITGGIKPIVVSRRNKPANDR